MTEDGLTLAVVSRLAIEDHSCGATARDSLGLQSFNRRPVSGEQADESRFKEGDAISFRISFTR